MNNQDVIFFRVLVSIPRSHDTAEGVNRYVYYGSAQLVLELEEISVVSYVLKKKKRPEHRRKIMWSRIID